LPLAQPSAGLDGFDPRPENIGLDHFLEERTMLRAALVFLVIALLAGALGLYNLEGVAANIAWVLFVVFLFLAVLSFVFGGRPPRSIE
jgi:uncharacterized membrane protein YtjA (UPF0391 family)